VSHLHVVDGVLPWWVALAALVLAAAGIALALRGRRDADQVRLLARVGVIGAALVAVMSVPLGPGIHLSLAPLAGMMLGPGGGFLAAFLANACLASLGHGGITALGVNGLFLGLQAAAGGGLFALLRRFLGVRAAATSASAAVLVLAAACAIAALRELPLEPALPGAHGHDHDHDPGRADGAGTWIVIAFAAAAAAAETALTAAVIGFLARVRADLVHGGGHPRPRTSGEPA
jgi:cobalt/nickel transport system permease protein